MAAITRISIAAGAGDTLEFIPAAGKAWEVNYAGSDKAFVSGFPDVEIGLKKGALTAILTIDPTTDPGGRNKAVRIFVTMAVTLTVKNTGGAGAKISISGKTTPAANVLTDILTVPGGGTIEFDPGITYDALVTALGSDTWTAGPADVNPDMIVGFTDGTLVASKLWDQTMICGHDMGLQLYTNHACRLLFTAAPAVNIGISAIKAGVPVISRIANIATGAPFDIIPDDGDEYDIFNVAAEMFTIAAAPDAYPNVTVSIHQGADLSDIMETTVSEGWNFGFPFGIRIDHTHYLTVVNNDALDNEIAVLGFLAAQY